MSKLLDSIRAAAAARQALNADKSARAADGGAVRGAAEGDDSPLMMAMRRADALNGDAASAVKTQADVQRETDRARNAIGAAQTREAIERGEAAAAKRRAAAEEAARQLARDRIEAEKSAEAAALARINADEQATRAAAERANSEREAAAAAQRKADAERAALNAEVGRAHV